MCKTINIEKLLEKQIEIEKSLRDMRNENSTLARLISQEDVWASQQIINALRNLSKYHLKVKVGE